MNYKKVADIRRKAMLGTELAFRSKLPNVEKLDIRVLNENEQVEDLDLLAWLAPGPGAEPLSGTPENTRQGHFDLVFVEGSDLYAIECEVEGGK